VELEGEPGGEPESSCDRNCGSVTTSLESAVITGRIRIVVAMLALAIPTSGPANSEC